MGSQNGTPPDTTKPPALVAAPEALPAPAASPNGESTQPPKEAEQPVEPAPARKNGEELYFARLPRSEGRQHLWLVVGFTVLTITGFMVYLPEEALLFLGVGFHGAATDLRMLIHRMGAIVLFCVSGYHLYYIVFTKDGRRFFLDMLPRLRDVGETFGNLSYYIGRSEHPPDFDRFNYRHKAEYFALVAGNTLMGISGLLLWTEEYWDKFILDIALIVHSMEAVLACLAIMVWHLYEVHFGPHKYPYDTTWLDPLVSESEMKEMFPAHYRRIMADPALMKIYLRKADGSPADLPEGRAK